MRLRSQLLLLSLLFLALPWTGCQYLHELERTLRQGQANTVLATATAIAQVTSQEAYRFYRSSAVKSATGQAIYAYPLNQAPRIDGDNNDWDLSLDSYRRLSLGEHGFVNYVAATHGNSLYLYLYVFDKTVIYPQQQFQGDRVFLHSQDQQQRWRSHRIQVSAPGWFNAQFHPPGGAWQGSGISGQWLPHPDGYSIELSMPLAEAGDLFAFSVIDVSQANLTSNDNSSWQSFAAQDDVASTAQPQPGPLLYRDDSLKDLLLPFARSQQRVTITDNKGWVLSSWGYLNHQPQNDDNSALPDWLYRLLLGSPQGQSPPLRFGAELRGWPVGPALSGQASASWYPLAGSDNSIIAAAQPIYHKGELYGVVMVEESSDAAVSLTKNLLTDFGRKSLLTLTLAGAALLGLAAWWSYRIRQLRNYADRLLTEQEFGNFQHSHANDELGDLSRSFNEMAQRLQSYTDYLQGLASRLSHELRTPLAVVSTSLANLQADETQRPFLQRADQGLQRLNAIVTNMSEATRIEQSLQQQSPEQFNLVQVLESISKAYQDVYPQFKFSFISQQKSALLVGSPDLIVQLLDKLISNAADYTPDQGAITIDLGCANGQAIVNVCNDGSCLTNNQLQTLFNPLVSYRDNNKGGSHLGLGLYVAKIIATGHQGSISVSNRAQLNGVNFKICLPLVTNL